jgi:hypothetical protein
VTHPARTPTAGRTGQAHAKTPAACRHSTQNILICTSRTVAATRQDWRQIGGYRACPAQETSQKVTTAVLL